MSIPVPQIYSYLFIMCYTCTFWNLYFDSVKYSLGSLKLHLKDATERQDIMRGVVRWVKGSKRTIHVQRTDTKRIVGLSSVDLLGVGRNYRNAKNTNQNDQVAIWNDPGYDPGCPGWPGRGPGPWRICFKVRGHDLVSTSAQWPYLEVRKSIAAC